MRFCEPDQFILRKQVQHYNHYDNTFNFIGFIPCTFNRSAANRNVDMTTWLKSESCGQTKGALCGVDEGGDLRLSANHGGRAVCLHTSYAKASASAMTL